MRQPDLTLPGYRYCGPGTRTEIVDVKYEGNAVNKTDYICRMHDYAYDNAIFVDHIIRADQDLLDKLKNDRCTDRTLKDDLVRKLLVRPIIACKLKYMKSFSDPKRKIKKSMIRRSNDEAEGITIMIDGRNRYC